MKIRHLAGVVCSVVMCLSLSAVAQRVIPSGTSIHVRTDEAIQATAANQGRTFPATVSQDVSDSSGQVLVPRGSDGEAYADSIVAALKSPKTHAPLDFDGWWKDVAEAVRAVIPERETAPDNAGRTPRSGR